MKIDIIRPTVILSIDKKKIEMNHNDLELLFEKLRVHLGKNQYYPYFPLTYATNGTLTGNGSSGQVLTTSNGTATIVNANDNTNYDLTSTSKNISLVGKK